MNCGETVRRVIRTKCPMGGIDESDVVVSYTLSSGVDKDKFNESLNESFNCLENTEIAMENIPGKILSITQEKYVEKLRCENRLKKNVMPNEIVIKCTSKKKDGNFGFKTVLKYQKELI